MIDKIISATILVTCVYIAYHMLYFQEKVATETEKNDRINAYSERAKSSIKKSKVEDDENINVKSLN